MATTHFDVVKTWGAATEHVTVAGFAFDPQTYAPTYRLIYGAPGRSLAIEIAQRLGLPLPVVAAARSFLSDDQKKVQAHLDRLDAQARALDADRGRLDRERRALNDQRTALEARERTLGEREEAFKKRLNERLDDRLRQARREIDAVIDDLKEKSAALAEKASLRAAGVAVNTGESGSARAEARAAVERIAENLRGGAPSGGPLGGGAPVGAGSHEVEPTVGARVAVGALGLEGTVAAIHGRQAEVDVRGKRMRAKLKDLRVLDAPPSGDLSGSPERSRVRVSVNLRPREGLPTEINVIGCTVEEAVDRVSRFLDDTIVTDLRDIRIVHGFGTGQLRKGLHAFLNTPRLVLIYAPAPYNLGGGGATLVELKD
jgi:DNA mismatch repair protein MutS2